MYTKKFLENTSLKLLNKLNKTVAIGVGGTSIYHLFAICSQNKSQPLAEQLKIPRSSFAASI